MSYTYDEISNDWTLAESRDAEAVSLLSPDIQHSGARRGYNVEDQRHSRRSSLLRGCTQCCLSNCSSICSALKQPFYDNLGIICFVVATLVGILGLGFILVPDHLGNFVILFPGYV